MQLFLKSDLDFFRNNLFSSVGTKSFLASSVSPSVLSILTLLQFDTSLSKIL
jgi:hypothetical protein